MVELRNFFMQLETTLGSGIPLVRALNLIAENVKGWGMKGKVQQVAHLIDKGATFSEAMEKVGSPFTGLQISFIKFGEETGCLDKVCGSLAAHAEKEINLNRGIVNSLLYPGFVLAVALCVGPIVQTVAVKQQPWTAALVPAALNLGGFALVIFLGTLFFRWMGGGTLDAILVRIPFLGSIFQDLALARFTRALSVGLFAGVPLLQTLTTALSVSGNPWLQGVLQHLPQHVSGGKNIASGLEKAGCLPGTLREMIIVGEQSGKLPEMLEKTAHYFEEEAANRVNILMKLLPSIVFVVVAIYVGLKIVTGWQAIMDGRGGGL